MTSTPAFVGCGPLARVDGPLPLRPQFGLLQAAEAPAAGVQILTDADGAGVERWMNGVQVFPYPPSVGAAWDSNSVGSDRLKDVGDDVPDLPIFGPMTAYLAETCFSYKVWSQSEYRARALAAFEAVESSIVASEFMRGSAIIGNPHLADGNGVFPHADVATSIRNGVALLEQAIADTGRQGVMHVSPAVLSSFREPWAIDKSTGVVRTLNGLVVIPDFGYNRGATPTGHAAATGTQEWIYATGPVQVRRSETFVLPDRVEQALDRGVATGATNGLSNQFTYRVERYYLVDWDTQFQAAVLVDRCSDSC